MVLGWLYNGDLTTGWVEFSYPHLKSGVGERPRGRGGERRGRGERRGGREREARRGKGCAVARIDVN